MEGNPLESLSESKPADALSTPSVTLHLLSCYLWLGTIRHHTHSRRHPTTTRWPIRPRNVPVRECLNLSGLMQIARESGRATETWPQPALQLVPAHSWLWHHPGSQALARLQPLRLPRPPAAFPPHASRRRSPVSRLGPSMGPGGVGVLPHIGFPCCLALTWTATRQAGASWPDGRLGTGS